MINVMYHTELCAWHHLERIPTMYVAILTEYILFRRDSPGCCLGFLDGSWLGLS